MLELKKTAITFDESEIMEIERIVIDDDEKEALRFVKKTIYEQILHAQQGKLKSHLDSPNPVEGFIQQSK